LILNLANYAPHLASHLAYGVQPRVIGVRRKSMRQQWYGVGGLQFARIDSRTY
jgi:hypothetical protein